MFLHQNRIQANSAIVDQQIRQPLFRIGWDRQEVHGMDMALERINTQMRGIV